MTTLYEQAQSLTFELAAVDARLSALIGNERHQNRIIDPLLDERNRITAALQLEEVFA